MINVLVVDDEPQIRDMLVFALSDDYHLHTAANANETWHILGEFRPDVILLDWMLPDSSGIDILRRLRKDKRFNDIPVIMLTAKGEEQDKIKGLDAGADDYLPKPFSLPELKARIRAQTRRTLGSGDELIVYKGFEISTIKHTIKFKSKNLELGPTEFKLLCFFATHPAKVYSREQLIDRVWGSNVYIEERTVDVHVLRLRKALKSVGADGFISTIRSIGYRFGDI